MTECSAMHREVVLSDDIGPSCPSLELPSGVGEVVGSAPGEEDAGIASTSHLSFGNWLNVVDRRSRASSVMPLARYV